MEIHHLETFTHDEIQAAKKACEKALRSEWHRIENGLSLGVVVSVVSALDALSRLEGMAVAEPSKDK